MYGGKGNLNKWGLARPRVIRTRNKKVWSKMWQPPSQPAPND